MSTFRWTVGPSSLSWTLQTYRSGTCIPLRGTEHKEECMRRFISTFALALASASLLAIHANAQSETKTKLKTEHGQTVTYTGCVGAGTESRTYILQNVQPISTT